MDEDPSNAYLHAIHTRLLGGLDRFLAPLNSSTESLGAKSTSTAECFGAKVDLLRLMRLDPDAVGELQQRGLEKKLTRTKEEDLECLALLWGAGEGEKEYFDQELRPKPLRILFRMGSRVEVGRNEGGGNAMGCRVENGVGVANGNQIGNGNEIGNAVGNGDATRNGNATEDDNQNNHDCLLWIRTIKPFKQTSGTKPNYQVGFTLWGAALVFGLNELKNARIFYGKQVLEIGSGLGLAGFAVALMGSPKRVTLSDFHSSVVQNLRHNVKLNGLQQVCDVTTLDWDDCEDDGQIKEKYDILIGSDVVCQASDCDGVARCLTMYLNHTPDAKGIFCLGSSQSRYGVDEFEARLGKHGFCICVVNTTTEKQLMDMISLQSDADGDLVIGKATSYTTYVVTRAV